MGIETTLVGIFTTTIIAGKESICDLLCRGHGLNLNSEEDNVLVTGFERRQLTTVCDL